MTGAADAGFPVGVVPGAAHLSDPQWGITWTRFRGGARLRMGLGSARVRPDYAIEQSIVETEMETDCLTDPLLNIQMRARRPAQRER